MQQIKIKISPNGHIEAETIGIKGKKCLKYIDKIEKMANAVCDDSAFTDEYYENEVEETVVDENEVHI